MLFLSGVTNDRIQRRLVSAGCGVLVQPGSGYVGRVGAFPAFAADNGCFTTKGTFNEKAWYRWLCTVPTKGCLFAVAPDVVGDHYATLTRSTPWLSRIRALGLPAAFVAQNGATPTNILWDLFDVLFLKTADGVVIEGFKTKKAAEAMKVAGHYVTQYALMTRWYAGEPVAGYRPYVEVVAERAVNRSFQAGWAAFRAGDSRSSLPDADEAWLRGWDRGQDKAATAALTSR